jgi:small subunit ribosomal protein S3
LQTLRADIDYGTSTAFTTYGTIGIRVWIYKGEIFARNSQKEEACDAAKVARYARLRGEACGAPYAPSS